jgi:hypothetical protein
MSVHKQDSIKFPNRLLYKTINNDWANAKVEILEKKDYQNREEMEMVEKGLFKSLNPTLNKNKGTSKHYNHDKYMKNEKYKLKMREYMYNKVQEQKKLKILLNSKMEKYNIYIQSGKISISFLNELVVNKKIRINFDTSTTFLRIFTDDEDEFTKLLAKSQVLYPNDVILYQKPPPPPPELIIIPEPDIQAVALVDLSAPVVSAPDDTSLAVP